MLSGGPADNICLGHNRGCAIGVLPTLKRSEDAQRHGSQEGNQDDPVEVYEVSEAHPPPCESGHGPDKEGSK